MFVNQNQMPGIGDAQDTYEANLTWGRTQASEFSGKVLDSAAVDAGNTPTTILRPGLILAQLANGKLTNYDPTVAAKSVPYGILAAGVNMMNFQTNTVQDVQCRFLYAGQVKVSPLIGFDESVRASFSNRMLFDDRFQGPSANWSPIQNLTANKTLVAADNAASFETTGAAGALTVTLPTPARGLRFKFTVGAAFAINIASAGAGQLIIPGNAAASTTAIGSASSAALGMTMEVYANAAGTSFICTPNAS